MGEYDGPERRSQPHMYDMVRAIRDEVRAQLEMHQAAVDQRVSAMEDRLGRRLDDLKTNQDGFKHEIEAIKARQDACQQKINDWASGAKWVNYAAITLAGLIVALVKVWEWLKAHA